MPKYVARIAEMVTWIHIVEAENEEAAEKLVRAEADQWTAKGGEIIEFDVELAGA